MKSCCKCGKSLLSAHILCTECKDSDSLPLRYYIDQLAEEIVLDHAGMCSFCVWDECDHQQSGLTCRNGVKEYLIGKIETYAYNLNANTESLANTKQEDPLFTGDGTFAYGGYHFAPYRKFAKGEIERQAPNDSRPWKIDTRYAMRNMRTDTEVGLSKYDWRKADYSCSEFYAASGDSNADIFMCVENGKLYVPGENELFCYTEPPKIAK